MHHAFNAFLLLALIFTSTILFVAPVNVSAASTPVKFGIRVWNFNTTHIVPNGEVSLMNKSIIDAFATTNGTGWANITAPNPGTFTLQIAIHTITIYNATLLLNQTTSFVNLTSTNVADYSIIFVDALGRHVQDVKADLRVGSSTISSALSAANGTAIARNLPFHSYNITATREGVFIANRTIVVNSTTYNRNILVTVPLYSYAITLRDYLGVNIVQTGTASIYDSGVPTNNATASLTPQATFGNLWPGEYWVVATSRNATILRSFVTIASNLTQVGVKANIGYTITLHVFDALNRPIPSVPVNLVQSGIVVATLKTDSSGIVSFTNLPQTIFLLNLTVLQRSYATPANITGTPLDLSMKIDDVLMLAGAPFNTAPLAASSALILTVIAILGTALLYRRRKGLSGSSTAKSKESSK